MGKNDTPQKILKVIKASKNVLIIMDSRFDYDALGSVLSFSDVLKQLHIGHRCVYGYKIPQKPKEYFDTGRIEENVDLKTFDYTPHDLVVFLDSGNLEHITKSFDYFAPKNKTTLNIDHHAGNNCYGMLNYVQIKASTGSVLYDLFKRWRVDITPQIANFLLACQITDTGLLQFNNVNSTELKIVIDLIEKGGNYFGFVSFLTNNEDIEDMLVKGLIYSNLKVDKKRGYAYSVLLNEEIEKKGAKGYGIVAADVIKHLSGVNFVFTIRTEPELPNAWNISMRSHDMNYNVLRIAQKFNGGGHKVAAGFNLPFSQAKTIEDVVEKVWQTASQN